MKRLIIFAGMLFLNCTIEENYPDEVRIVGDWFNSGRTAVLKNGDVFNNWYLLECETKTNYIFNENGVLLVEDYINSEIQDGSTDFCVLNEKTSLDGSWKILSPGKFRMTVINEDDNTEMEIEPYNIEFIQKNRMNIRYKEFEEIERDSVSYLIYHFIRIYN